MKGLMEDPESDSEASLSESEASEAAQRAEALQRYFQAPRSLVWDPAQLAADAEALKHRRSVELKRGRLAMLATGPVDAREKIMNE